MDSIISDIVTNDLLFGKDKEERIVGAYQLSDTHIRLFIRDEGGVRHRDEQFYPFFFLSDSSLLDGFVPDDMEKFWLVKSVGVINREDKSYVQIMFDSGVSFEEEIYKVILSNTTKESSDAHSQNALLEAEVASAYIM